MPGFVIPSSCIGRTNDGPALSKPSTSTIQEDLMIITPARPLRCLVGHHRWHTVSTEDGSNHWQCCAQCGKDRPRNLYTHMNLPPSAGTG